MRMSNVEVQMRGRGDRGRQIRNPKHEIRNKFEIQMYKRDPRQCRGEYEEDPQINLDW